MHVLLMAVQLLLWEILPLWLQQFVKSNCQPILPFFHLLWTTGKKQQQLDAYQPISYEGNLDLLNMKSLQVESLIVL
ncbi:hypothetical protein EAI_14111 [Harpegnathos saltator]|uniref:Uncharacterized protein n=1 Tax=Harpegnathos saltator TaxID=610380 RepID=E2BQX4_HARSA|nr:hypothetical protein EAI_14111 [Harpegnathos saltator]